jgi:hypothetical protein
MKLPKIIIVILTSIIPFIIMYLLFSFSLMELNPKNWLIADRVQYCVMSFLQSVIVTSLTLLGLHEFK